MKRLQKIVGTVLFLLLLGFCIGGVSRYLRPKMSDFYREKEYDAVFFGTSECYCTLDPAVFDEYGLKTYNRGMPVQTMGFTYYYVKDALEHAKIDRVVVEVFGMSFAPERYDDLENADSSLNKMRDSATKWQAVRELMPKSQWTEYCFPLDKYHGEWEKKEYPSFHAFLKDLKTKYKVDVDRGYQGSDSSIPFEYASPEIRMDENRAVLYERNVDYLNRIYALCRKYDTELILVRAPVPCYWLIVEEANSIQDWADEHDVIFYNYYQYVEEIGFDANTDSVDGGEHLNTIGARKVSRHLATFFAERKRTETR